MQPCGQQAKGMRGGCDSHNQGYVYRRAQMDQGEGQECVPGGQLRCGELGWHAQTRGAQVQPYCSGLQQTKTPKPRFEGVRA